MPRQQSLDRAEGSAGCPGWEADVVVGSNSPVRLSRAARAASPSPADIRHDNQLVALGPMLSTLDRFRFLEKNRRWAGRDRHARPIDGRWWGGRWLDVEWARGWTYAGGIASRPRAASHGPAASGVRVSGRSTRGWDCKGPWRFSVGGMLAGRKSKTQKNRLISKGNGGTCRSRERFLSPAALSTNVRHAGDKSVVQYRSSASVAPRLSIPA
jgi:hypothetical protein